MNLSKQLNQRFISVEGIEGVGKTTVVNFIKGWFEQRKMEYVLTREPGGTPIAEEVRKLLLAQHSEVMSSDTELLLMFAGRAQNISAVIRPALAAGKWVISDRFTDASRAYQGGGRAIDSQHIERLAHWVQADLEPAHTLLLDAPTEIAMQRVHSRGAKDRIESEGQVFFERVREAYLDLAAANPARMHLIDAAQPLPEVLLAVETRLNTWVKCVAV